MSTDRFYCPTCREEFRRQNLATHVNENHVGPRSSGTIYRICCGPDKMRLIDIYELCKNRDELHETLMQWGVVPRQKKCKVCGGEMKLIKDASKADGFIYRCENVKTDKTKRKCYTKASYRSGTFFAGSKLSIFQIVVVEEIISSSKPIGGSGITVEIDESKIGKRKYNRGHAVDGTWVFGALERGSGRIIMQTVDRRDKDTLMGLIKKWILPGSTIISDCWRAYDTIGKEGYEHLTVNHNLHFKDPDSGACTNGIESSWRHAKHVICSYGRKKDHIPGNLAKYSFLKNCRSKSIDASVDFFRCASILYDGNPMIVEDTPSDAEHLSSDSE